MFCFERSFESNLVMQQHGDITSGEISFEKMLKENSIIAGNFYELRSVWSDTFSSNDFFPGQLLKKLILGHSKTERELDN